MQIQIFSLIDLKKHKKATTTNLPYCHIDPRTHVECDTLIGTVSTQDTISIHALM